MKSESSFFKSSEQLNSEQMSLDLFSEESGQESFENLIERLKACRSCAQQFGFEPRPIQWGAADAKILVISQAPGQRVQKLGRPFADLSGKKLRQQWFLVNEEQFYNPHLFYFSMAGHCFPGKDARGNDRKPPKCCWPKWGRKELERLHDCRLYLVIGKEAASRIFPGRSLEDLVFSDLKLRGTPCFVLPHPSPLNYRWLQAHPQFEQSVVPRLQKAVHSVLGNDSEIFPVRFGPESWEK